MKYIKVNFTQTLVNFGRKVYNELRGGFMEYRGFERISETDADINHIVCINQNWPVTHNSWNYLEHARPNDGIIYIKTGQAVYTMTDGRELSTDSGDVLYLPKRSRYIVKFTPDSKSLLLNFKLYCHREELYVSDGVFKICKDKNSRLLREFDELCRLYSGSVNRLLLKSKVYALFDSVLDLGTANRTESVAAYINNHLNTPQTVSKIAASCAMSESSLRRRMLLETGLSPVRYIAKQKAEKAMQLLAIHELSVEDISAILGYYDASHFIKGFKKQTGMTPTQYRKVDHIL